MNVFEAVQEFNEKFHFKVMDKPGLLNEHLFQMRANFMIEELREYTMAHEVEDLPEMLDGLIDLLYVVVGTMHFHGWTSEQQVEAFRRVHEANMKKVPVRHEGESKRGTLYDAKKPKGWIPPDLKDLCI